LTFREYRASPLGNPYLSWQPKDADANGQVTQGEYHATGTASHQLLSNALFAKLDRNQDTFLTLDEVRFSVDQKKAPLELVFRLRDKDTNGRLTVAEAVDADRPEDGNADAVKKYEERVMRIEDAFRLADQNHDAQLSVDEFAATEDVAAVIVPGRGRSKPTAIAQVQAATAELKPPSWSGRMIGLVSFNVLLLIGLAWLLLRTPARR
jgi:hypothetical protein